MKYSQFKITASPKTFEYNFDKTCNLDVCCKRTTRCRRWYDEDTSTMIQVIDCGICEVDEGLIEGFELVEVFYK
jgi:hypothetical protein